MPDPVYIVFIGLLSVSLLSLTAVICLRFINIPSLISDTRKRRNDRKKSA